MSSSLSLPLTSPETLGNHGAFVDFSFLSSEVSMLDQVITIVLSSLNILWSIFSSNVEFVQPLFWILSLKDSFL